MVRTHRDDPPLTTVEAARIARITGMAMVRGGQLTTKQKTTIDRILKAAHKRADQQKGK